MSGPEELAERLQAERESLATLRTSEAHIAELRRHEARLEVERLAADAALAAGLKHGRPRIDPRRASELVAALAQLRSPPASSPGSRARGGPTPAGEAQRAARLRRVAIEALEAWLEAPNVRDSTRIQTIARIVLGVLTVAAIWAAVAVHPAFLLLLVPIVVPLSLLMRPGENTSWRRMGARRHFDHTGLAAPAQWTADGVGERLAALRAELADSPELPDQIEQADQAEQAAEAEATGDLDLVPDAGAGGGGELDLVTAELALEELREELGVAEIGPLEEQWLGTLANAYRARQALSAAQAARQAADAQAGAVREHLYRFLSRHGAAPAGGNADADALAAGLERVRRAQG